MTGLMRRDVKGAAGEYQARPARRREKPKLNSFPSRL
jgi:hypothetical protein